MTACQRIKKHLLENICRRLGVMGYETNENNIDFLYSKFWELDRDLVQDEEEKFRRGDCKTNIRPEQSKYYESYSVAKKLSDGSWVGWTYWVEAEWVAWMERAYALKCEEKEVVRTERVFTKI